MTRSTLALIFLPVDLVVVSLCVRLLPASQACTGAVALAVSTSAVLLLAPSRLESWRCKH